MGASFTTTTSLADAQARDAVQRLFTGKAPPGLSSVPREERESVYNEACQRMDAADFEGALAHLQYLVVHDPYDFRFQFRFGLCLHQLGSVIDAAKHYGLAWMLDPGDAGCAFRLGECHAAMGDREAAHEAFQTAIALCSAPAQRPEIRVACEVALSRLET